MINFISSQDFDKETAKLQRRFPHFNAGLESFKRICEKHFHPIKPQQVFAPGKLHRVKDCDSYTIWKIEMVVKNLKSNHFPRIWFAVQGSTLILLCARTHIDNYDNNEVDRIAYAISTSFF